MNRNVFSRNIIAIFSVYLIKCLGYYLLLHIVYAFLNDSPRSLSLLSASAIFNTKKRLHLYPLLSK